MGEFRRHRPIASAVSLAVGLLVLSAGPDAHAQSDIGDALSFIGDTIGDQTISNYDDQKREHDQAAIAMLVSRDVQKNVDLEDYTCDESIVDGTATLRTSAEDMWALRECRMQRWKRSSLPGYKTLGDTRLSPADVDTWLEHAQAETTVAKELMHPIIAFKSGYRPGVISDDGHIGLMQLKPEHLDRMGVKYGNLLDPRENILAGARYLRALVLEGKSIKVGLAAYANPYTFDDDKLLAHSKTKWFVREVYMMYLAQVREFPVEIAAETMMLVFTWMD